jgi:hypothetical protein
MGLIEQREAQRKAALDQLHRLAQPSPSARSVAVTDTKPTTANTPAPGVSVAGPTDVWLSPAPPAPGFSGIGGNEPGGIGSFATARIRQAEYRGVAPHFTDAQVNAIRLRQVATAPFGTRVHLFDPIR